MKAVRGAQTRRTAAAIALVLIVALFTAVLASSAHIHRNLEGGKADQHCALCDLGSAILAIEHSASLALHVPELLSLALVASITSRYRHTLIRAVSIRPPPALSTR
jgi:hypothetical protein